MSGPIFASPQNVTRTAHRLGTLCELMIQSGFRFYAVEDANQVFISWVKAFHRQELNPEDNNDDEDEGWGVTWEDPDQEHDVGTLLALVMGEINAGKRLSDTTTCLF